MNSHIKCFNCINLKYKKNYPYPFACKKHTGYSSTQSEIQDYFEKPCKFFKMKTPEEEKKYLELGENNGI